MNGSTTKLLKAFYGTFYYRDPEVFERSWKTIKKTWDSLSAPTRKKAADRMRRMLDRYAKAAEKAQKALPNLNAIMQASQLLAEKGLPTGEIPSATDEPEGRRQSDETDDTDPRGHSLGGT